MEKDCLCKKHDGVERDLIHFKETNIAQWREINGMKKFIIATLASAVLTLMVVVINLMINLNGS